MTDRKLPTAPSSAAEVAEFLARLARTPAVRPGAAAGRLLFAIDATASRGPTWDVACALQSEMFGAAALLGGLEVQLCYYRGFGEFRATPWIARAEELIRLMTGVACLAGRTQIGRVLDHAIAETRRRKVSAVVFIGDAVEENIDALGHKAGELGLLATPVFVFHEGGEPRARRALEQIARLSGGAYCPFDAGSAEQLRQLLTAVAVFSAGGQPALEAYGRSSGGLVLQIAHQMTGAQ